jgi:biotin transport system substrate-specific component
MKIVAAVAGTALAAQVALPVPWTPVPLTLQTLAVLLTGFALGPWLAPAAMLVYLALGSLGLGVFAAGSAGFAGVTGGYLIGFVPAAAMVGVLSRGGGRLRRLEGAVVGTALIFAAGVGWLAAFMGTSIEQALQAGVYPFLLDAVLKIAVALAAVEVVQLRRRRSHHG